MFSHEIPIFRFEDIEVDVRRGRLKRGSEERHLRQKAFSVLVYLLENNGSVITKDELIDRVWNGAAVVDDALVQCIKDIRRVLNDDPHRPRFIRTIPKLGYQFVSPVIQDANARPFTEVEEIARVETKIEGKSILFTAIGSKLRPLIASLQQRFFFPIAAVFVIAAAAGLFYISPTLNGARSAYSALTPTLTEDPEAHRYYSLGVEKAQAVQNKEAIECFEKAIKLDPEFAMAYARIGYVYALTWAYPDKGKPYLEQALKLPARLSEKDKLHIEAWYAIADQDYAAAIPPLRELISRFPSEIEAYWRLGRVLTGMGQHKEAVAVLRQGLSVDPEAKNIYNFLGGLTSMLGRHDEAIALERRYVELAPGEPNSYDSLGMAYQHAGRYAEAATQYQHALDLKPDFEVVLAHFANTRFQQGRYREAIRLYEKYVELAPSETEKARGYSRISIIYARLNDLTSAEKAAQLAVSYNKEDLTSLLFALYRNDLTAARALETQLLAKSKYAARGVGNDQRIKFYIRGMIALRKGQNKEALENFREILNLLPPTWDLLDFEDAFANALFETGQFDQSLEEYNRILQINPQYPLVYFHIARALAKLGRHDLAQENYKRFLEVWKDADADVPELVIARKHVG